MKICDTYRNGQPPHGLRLNPAKSKAILLANRNDIHPPRITLNGEQIAFYDNVTSLGLVMDRKLNWHDHVSGQTAKIVASLRGLWPNAHIIPRQTRCMLVKTMLLPIFNLL